MQMQVMHPYVVLIQGKMIDRNVVLLPHGCDIWL
jgi:hypothetical protein